MLRELKTFVAVAREGTFASAGEKVGLTQAAVSAQMQRLEADLGFALFDRTGRSARLNPKGRQALGQAQELLRLYSGLGSSDLDPNSTTLLTIGAVASVQRIGLPAALAKFCKEQSDCRIRVIPGTSMELLNLVDAGEIDLAAIVRPPFSLQNDLRWRTIAHEPFRLLVPRSIKGTDWSEVLTQHPFIRYDRGSFGGRKVDHFLRAKRLAVRQVCELDEPDAILRLVAKGVGVSLVPEASTQRRWPNGVRAIDLGHQTFYRDLGLVHRSTRLSEPVRRLAELLFDAMSGSGQAAKLRQR